jgi:hypothetical protein
MPEGWVDIYSSTATHITIFSFGAIHTEIEATSVTGCIMLV